MKIKSSLLEKYKSAHISVAIKELGLSSETKVLTLQSPSATLIMRQHGNEYRKLPSLVDKAINLASAAKDVVKALTSNVPVIAPDNVVEYRLLLCKKCAYYDKERFCRSCGCITDAKVKLSASRCPEGKWRSL